MSESTEHLQNELIRKLSAAVTEMYNCLDAASAWVKHKPECRTHDTISRPCSCGFSALIDRAVKARDGVIPTPSPLIADGDEVRPERKRYEDLSHADKEEIRALNYAIMIWYASSTDRPLRNQVIQKRTGVPTSVIDQVLLEDVGAFLDKEFDPVKTQKEMHG